MEKIKILTKEFIDENNESASKEGWLRFIKEEAKNVRKRFGNDKEALEFFPDNYYELMEDWWKIPENREIDPITISVLKGGKIFLEDGWHRVAIAIKLGIEELPAIVRYRYRRKIIGIKVDKR